MHFTKVNIESLNKKPLKDIANVINDRLNLLSKTFKYSQWYLVVIDVTEFKLCKQPPTNSRKKRLFSKVYFSNKTVERIDLTALFDNLKLISLLKHLPHVFVTKLLIV